MAGPTSLTPSILLQSGAFGNSDGESDVCDDFEVSGSGSGSGSDRETDESTAAAIKHAFASFEHAMPTIEDAETHTESYAALLAHVSAMTIGEKQPPRPLRLDAAPMAIIVQFFAEDRAAEKDVFLFETDELLITRGVLTGFIDNYCVAPYRIDMRITTTPDAGAGAGAGADDPYCSDAVCLFADATANTVSEDPWPANLENWIPEKGRINVLAVFYSEAPVIAGLLTERYDARFPRTLDDAPAPEAANFTTDRISTAGKRILWLESATPGKRARTNERGDAVDTAYAEGEMCDASVVSPVQAILTGMHDFASNGNQEWTSASNRENLVCAFERDYTTGQLTRLRIAIAFESLRLRSALLEMLAHKDDCA